MDESSVFKKQVLTAFQKVSPSKIVIEEDFGFQKYFKNHNNLFRYKLHFPPELFKNKQVIDFGCGTGELDVVMASWGASVTGFDFNPISVARANTLKRQFRLSRKLSFQEGDVDSFPFESESFDMAVSYGVIAHVPDQEKMFQRMTRACRKGGYVILGWVEEAGLIQRLLHRAICLVNVDESEEKIYEIAWNCFREHIERSVRIGGRTAESVINDYLINPHYHGIGIEKVISWALEEKCEFYSSWPPVTPPFCIDSPYFPSLSMNSKFNRKFLALLKLRWMFAQEEDEKVFEEISQCLPAVEETVSDLMVVMGRLLQDKAFTPQNLEATKRVLFQIEREIKQGINAFGKLLLGHFADLSSELRKIIKLIVEKASCGKDFPLARSSKLFHGYNGLGTTYAIFYKPEHA